MGKENVVTEKFVARPPYLCTIKICGYPVNIFSEYDDYLLHFEDKKVSYVNDIPNWESSRIPNIQESSNIPAIHFFIGEKTQFKHIQNEQILQITGNPKDFEDGQALAYIGFWMTEAERQKEFTFILHASSIAIDRKGVLLIGDGGSGKTAIALGASKRYDCEFISNDLSIVNHNKNADKAFLLGSSKIIRLRLTTVKLNFPDLISMFDDHTDPAWTTKIPVKFEVLGLKTTSEPRLINAVFTVHLDSNPNEPVILKRVSDIETQFALYENLSRIVRGSAISVFDSNKSIMGYMPSLDTEELHQNRIDLINYLIKNVGVWNISGGNLDQICEIIKHITEESVSN